MCQTLSLKIKKLTFWEASEVAPLDPRGPTLLLLTLVLLRVLQFLPTVPLLGKGMPHLAVRQTTVKFKEKLRWVKKKFVDH